MKSTFRRIKNYARSAQRGDVLKLAGMAIEDAPKIVKVVRRGRKTVRKVRKAVGGIRVARVPQAVNTSSVLTRSGDQDYVRMDEKTKQGRMQGSQYLCNVGTWTNNGYIFGSFPTNNPYNNITRIGVHPTCFGGRLAEMAAFYTNYKFRQVRFRYVPTTAVTTTGQFTIGYTMSPVVTNAQTDGTGKVLTIEPSKSGPFYQPLMLDGKVDRATNKKNFRISFDSTAASSTLEFEDTVQGALVGIQTVNAPASTVYGLLIVDYDILFDTPIIADPGSLTLLGPITATGFDQSVPEAKSWSVVVNAKGFRQILPDTAAIVGDGYDYVVWRPAAQTRKADWIDPIMLRWNRIATGLSKEDATDFAAAYVPAVISDRAVAVGDWLPPVPAI